MSYETLIGIFIFLFGIVFGSFYNVIVYRLPLGMPIYKGRSMCFSCKHSLGFWDLFPLFSYIFLRGRCRYCGAKFSPRYFFVELTTGILFVIAYIKFGLSYDFILMVIFWSMLLIVALIDYDTMCVYDIILWVFSALCLITIIIEKGMNIKDNIFGALAGFLIYFAIYHISKFIYKKEAFGFGDVLLNTAIGLVLGVKFTILSSFLSFFVGLFFIIIMKIFGKKIGAKQEIPFGPYMCISAFIICVYGQNMIDFYINRFIL